jgi:hypothetical protein
MMRTTVVFFVATTLPVSGTSCRRQVMTGEHPFPYMSGVARLYGIDHVQVVNPRGTTFDRNKFIETLSEADFEALGKIYREIETRGDAARISEWVLSRDASGGLKDDRRRAFLLFVLFKALGDEWGIEPFSDKTVRLVAPPPKPLDWSKLPESLAWIVKPAEKYGVYRFPAEVDEFYTKKITPEDRAELRRLAAKCKEHHDEIERFLSRHPMTKHEEAAFVSFFRDLLDDYALWTD